MGDPNGIGPEVLLKTLADWKGELNPIIFGAPAFLKSLIERLNLSLALPDHCFMEVGEFQFPPKWGKVNRDAGDLALKSLELAAKYCQNHALPLLVTAPVCKESLVLAGFQYPGQTEFLGHLLGCPEKATMAFFSDLFHLVLVTVHIPFRSVPEELTTEKVISKGIQFWEALKAIGIIHPRIAVCGLNPHASESGIFGDEEKRILSPAIDILNQKCSSNTFTGPLPADTVFFRARRGDFDGVIALYHDQGLIPLKMVGFENAVNTTLGLPFIRISPDHGTGFDIAGRNMADHSSMMAAMRWGLKLSR
jgi:4-hydroxythreonine-4-phosphate dehydrogenase